MRRIDYAEDSSNSTFRLSVKPQLRDFLSSLLAVTANLLGLIWRASDSELRGILRFNYDDLARSSSTIGPPRRAALARPPSLFSAPAPSFAAAVTSAPPLHPFSTRRRGELRHCRRTRRARRYAPGAVLRAAETVRTAHACHGRANTRRGRRERDGVERTQARLRFHHTYTQQAFH